jgi:hypothetical protein
VYNLCCTTFSWLVSGVKLSRRSCACSVYKLIESNSEYPTILVLTGSTDELLAQVTDYDSIDGLSAQPAEHSSTDESLAKGAFYINIKGVRRIR